MSTDTSTNTSTNTSRSTNRHHRRAIAGVTSLAAIAALALSGCSDDGADASDEPGTITVEMSDFSFDNLPDSVPAGTTIEVTNTADAELHELVAFRLDDGDDRSIDEVLADPASLMANGPVLVALAAPGSDEQIIAVGDGTLAEPGRYLIACFIPTGADPDEYLAAAATSEGPPDVPGGPPHLAHGMVTELEVT